MDKKIKNQLEKNASVIGEQQEKITDQETLLKKNTTELLELRKFKLAFKIAEEMQAKELFDPEDFQEKVNILSTKSAKDLTKRKDVLAVRDVESALELGSVDEPIDNKIADDESKSATPHSQQSAEAMDSFIHTMIN